MVQVEPLEEHQVSNVLVARSSNPVAYSSLGNLHRILSKLSVSVLESVCRLELLDSLGDSVPLC